MQKILKVEFSDGARIETIGKALSAPLRVEILQLLSEQGMNVKEIAFRLNIPMSTAAVNIKILEDADLILTTLQPGKRGSMKMCNLKYEELNLTMLTREHPGLPAYTVSSMPIGGYTDFCVKPTCGLVSETKFIGVDDNPATFYSADRFQAQLLWFKSGYVSYRFPMAADHDILGLQFSLELCSEAPYYRDSWPSDITVWVNGVELGTWICPGDFGGRLGNHTPAWWPYNSTQFGLLKTWQITPEGTYLDYAALSGVRLEDLKLTERDYLSFTIGVKEDARNIGGINLFGEKFGDYPQNILMRIDYQK